MSGGGSERYASAPLDRSSFAYPYFLPLEVWERLNLLSTKSGKVQELESIVADKDDALKQELQQTKKKLKKTELELARKDKALAEFAALVALKKKPRRSGGMARKTDSRGRPEARRGAHRRGRYGRCQVVPRLRCHRDQHEDFFAMEERYHD